MKHHDASRESSLSSSFGSLQLSLKDDDNQNKQRHKEQKKKKEEEEEEEEEKFDLRLALIDHYDSYTYNLYDMLADLCLHPPIVLSKDFVVPPPPSSSSSLNNAPLSTLHRQTPPQHAAAASWGLPFHHDDDNDNDNDSATTTTRQMDGLVLSPGPGRPSCPDDMGQTLELIRRHEHLPILGVCLGHQAIGHVYGARVELNNVDGPVHGQVHLVHQDNTTNRTADTLWSGLESTMNATRYHSLVVKLPPNGGSLIPTAWYYHNNNDNEQQQQRVLMGLSHRTYPHYGVQFHPESIGTQPHGKQLLRNFCRICLQHRQQRQQLKQQQQQLKQQGKTSPRKTIPRMQTQSSWWTPNALNGAQQQQQQQQQQRLAWGLLTTDKARKETKATTTKTAHTTTTKTQQRQRTRCHVRITKVHSTNTTVPLPCQVFDELYANQSHVVWLDSSSSSHDDNDKENKHHTTTTTTTNARFSIMGGLTGPNSKLIEYHSWPSSSSLSNPNQQRERLVVVRNRNLQQDEETMYQGVDILDYLQSLQQTVDPVVSVVSCSNDDDDDAREEEDEDDLAFGYRGGYLGYLGYEVRYDTQQKQLQAMQPGPTPNQQSNGPKPSSLDTNTIPTAAFLYCDQSLVYDHLLKQWYIITITPEENNNNNNDDDDDDNNDKDDAQQEKEQEDWTRRVTELLWRWSHETSAAGPAEQQQQQQQRQEEEIVFVPHRSRHQYEQDIAECHEQIRQGESYELCLTNQLEAIVNNKKKRPLDLYKTLRRRNPAPFAAYFQSSQVSICCSSPERFVSVQPDNTTKKRILVEAKPIKGTRARPPLQWTTRKDNPTAKRLQQQQQQQEKDKRLVEELRNSVKDRAENLMIVDLLRNDLSRVCQPGTVHVPKLMEVESYTTVHQMVSTICGELSNIQEAPPAAIRVLEACFPGGSMTGAPKIRTMELLNGLEQNVPRGPYSGCLGYMNVNGMAMDLNIVIRSAVLTPHPKGGWKVSIGAGGAITALSQCKDEYEEMMWKAKAVQEAVCIWANEPTTIQQEDETTTTTVNLTPDESVRRR